MDMMAYPLLQPLVKILLHRTFDIKLIIDGPLPDGNYIISANHHSWLDPILVTLVWPGKIDMMYIGPGDVVTNTTWKKWFIGGMQRVVLTPQRVGWIGLGAYKQVMQGFEAGRSLLIFPEGDAYPQEGIIQPFYSGVAYFALKKGLPVVPVGLCGTADLYYRKKISVHIGLPIEIPYSLSHNKLQVEDTRKRIEDSNRILIDGYQDPEVTSKPLHWLTHLM
jgi:1-acyl-sn-glycerol-3-phosphate acyltransferase